ncbi:Sulphatase-modifying factor protein [Nitrosomonas sp. Is79A3]|uniref:SUMF1/EgtB/PvdO family nonheme iron enzyme n=1 Tax=Nitrosomonas sp. (strain Is79A3) TaxID=261292 RepID=UPI000215D4B4
MDSRKFYSRIDGLGALLRAEGMAHGVDVWMSVARLLERLERQGRLPHDASDLAPLLRPLFCRNPQDQARFPVLFEQWLKGESQSSLAKENRISSPGRSAFVAAQEAAQKTQKIWIMGGIALIVCVIAVLLVKGPDWFLPKPPPPPTIKIPEKPSQPIPRRKPQPATATVAIVDHIAPRPQPEPDYVGLEWESIVRNIGWALFALPWLPVLLILAWRYQRNAVLRKQTASVDDLLHHFRFDRLLQPFFGGAKAEQALRELHAARQVPTNRLHITATIEATARNGGFFQPVYRNRRVSPEHLLLVRSQHRNDQQAALAEELEKRFKALGLPINTYRFRDDPRWLVRWHDDDSKASYYQLQQLVARHEAARLLIISETAILFHPYSGEIRTWLDDLSPWQDKVWLHPRDAGTAHAALLAQHHFLMLPLAQDNLPQLVEHLTTPQPHKLMLQKTDPSPLPALIAAEPDAWLGERPPYGANLDLLVQQLEQFLHADGLRLLRAVAVFPKPHWALTRALDYLLFENLSTADPLPQREQRLARLSRLPWLTHAHLPDWLREYLLLGMDRDERQQIATAWQRLFNRLTDKDSPNSLSLEVRTPPKLQLKLKLDDLRALSQDDAINDPIFANILLGGKLGLLDFRIPQALAKLLPKTNQSLILRPALILLFWVLLGTGTLYAAWHYVGQHAFIDYQRNQMAQENAQWRVTLNHREDTQVLMEALQSKLKTAQFPVSIGSDTLNATTINTIHFARGGQAAAVRITRSLAWLTYGAAINVMASTDLSAGTIQVQLNRTYQHGAGFNDELRAAQESRLPFEPEMVRIPPGKFLMGSPKTEAGRSSNEDPQHEVTITYAFEISKYEVTFDEYDAFANATKRQLPSGGGWGRGKRPVINVSFNDAQAYVKWLSDKTGKQYRLPTEAEWEYAARAGSETAYWWGNDVGKIYANCAGCGSEWDGKQTAPADSFNPNAFGLHNTAGNVWEWVEDCWHENYQGAPADGSAWKEANGGDCNRRVVRGGSWSIGPLNLRSANRNRNFTVAANFSLGFRIARAF